MLYFKGGTFTHKSKGSTHSKRGLTHLTLNTQILKNAEKKRNNTQIKINKFVCLKVKKHLLNTQNVLLKHRIFLKTLILCVLKSDTLSTIVQLYLIYNCTLFST